MKQSSRESLVYLLYLALYADGILSETEDDSFTYALEGLAWEGENSLEDFSYQAFGKVRELITTPELIEAFMHEQAKLIQKNGDQLDAYTLISRVLKSDELEKTEKSYLRRLEQIWFPQ